MAGILVSASFAWVFVGLAELRGEITQTLGGNPARAPRDRLVTGPLHAQF